MTSKSKSCYILATGLAIGLIVLTGLLNACSPPSQAPPDNNAPAPSPKNPSQTPAPDSTYIEVNLEECAQNLGKNTGREHKAKGVVLQITKDEYIDFMKKDLYAYRSGGHPSATDAVTIKCSIRLLDYLNQMSPELKQRMADMYMAAYRVGYAEK